jgi:hypothetical protein
VRSFTKAFPKVALHRHREGSFVPEILLSVARRRALALPSYDAHELRRHLQMSENARARQGIAKATLRQVESDNAPASSEHGSRFVGQLVHSQLLDFTAS